MRSLLVLVTLAIVGCDSGPRLVKAGGIVKYKGALLAEAEIVFVPDAGGIPSIGRTDSEGRFSLLTSGREGAPVGEHKVSISAVRQKCAVPPSEAVGMTTEQIYANHETLIPVKYNNLISSGLTATVSDDPAKNEFSFELK